MPALKPITIVGGGLAGLALGIGLRQRGVPVTLWEAERYPRHRVCGEFISGRGQQVLRRLGLMPLLMDAGATEAPTAAFFLGAARSPARALTPPALCISRFKLDAALAAKFRECGGELHEAARWKGEPKEAGVVLATGRRVQPVEGGWRWFGLKAHANGVQLCAALEMHGSPQAYVGLCRLEGERVNVCGLFRRPAGARSMIPADWRETLRGLPGGSLHSRLAGAEFDAASFRAVAGLPLRPSRAQGRAECRIGDALTMIPPVTGNGMSMAFEAAELALDPLAAWSLNGLEWSAAQSAVARACDRCFASRLAWARLLHALMFSPMMQTSFAAVVLRSGWLWNLLFNRTR